MLFSLWDFAGHEEYHVSHSSFFRSGAVYLLLFDYSVDLEEIISKNKLLYWFHFLQTQVGKNSPVILIATKVDILQDKFFFKKEKKTKSSLKSINTGKKKKERKRKKKN